MAGLGRQVGSSRVARYVGALALSLAAMALDPAPACARAALVITVEGAIGPATAGYVQRSLATVEQTDAVVAVLRLDTPGGLDSAMRDIIRAMLASPVPVIAYVAPSGARAASAGTYILYASALAAMAPGTNLGAATPVALFGETPLPTPGRMPVGDKNDAHPAGTEPARPEAMATKVTNDAAAYIRGLATMHGRNAEWAERAVREAVSLSYDAALAQHVIELVAGSLPDLLAAADGRTVIVKGKPMRLATAGLEIVTHEPNWRERLLALVTDPNIVYLLLLGGLLGIAFELSHPGLIAPGVVGVICLLVGGYGLHLLPVDYAGLALTLLGIGLMAAEAFVPAFGALGLGGAAAFAIGSLMMFATPGSRPSVGVIVGATMAAAALFCVVLRLLLRARRRPVVTGNAMLIGAAGRIMHWAGSEGVVLVAGERWRARAVLPLAPGQRVKIVDRQGLVLLVEPL